MHSLLLKPYVVLSNMMDGLESPGTARTAAASQPILTVLKLQRQVPQSHHPLNVFLVKINNKIQA